jgi:hypothetical protein
LKFSNSYNGLSTLKGHKEETKMFTFIQNYNKKFKDANNWIALAKVREEQKQALQLITGPQESISVQAVVQVTEHVIFSRDDTGHNQAEAHKIEEIYTELGKVPFSPTLAI